MTTVFHRLIAEHGPLPIDQYMQAALTHRTKGYYQTRMPFGAQGDFVTAPEISQMFGELLGLWVITVWQRLGMPERFHLVELGPGRGVLMADALRVIKRQAHRLFSGLHLHMVEVSSLLIESQKTIVGDAGCAVHWYPSLTAITLDGPLCILANEFLDALPARQLVYHNNQWYERCVDLDTQTGKLMFVLGKRAVLTDSDFIANISAADLEEGVLLEVPEAVTAVVKEVATLLAMHRGAALFIDYGHGVSGTGETLQAVRSHTYTDVLESPGEADLTVHVDFAHVIRTALASKVEGYGPVFQGAFLKALGIDVRADQLMKASQRDAQRETIIRAYHRLVSAEAMGRLFKVVALASQGFGAPEGMSMASVR